MSAQAAMTGAAAPFSTDDDRWRAVVQRDRAADGMFYYSVRTTGVYCRPGCAAKAPLRKNVRFHDTCEQAEAAGFRPCQRCRPNAPQLNQRHSALIAQACRLIEQADTPSQLADLAAAAGMSASHFHRLFKAHTGVTPRAYAAAHRAKRVRQALTNRQGVTHAIYGAGFGSSSRFYESSHEVLGMTATQFRAGGRGLTIRFAVGQCWLGAILVAASEKGICAILLGDDPDHLVRELQDRFPSAALVGGDGEFERWVAAVVGFVAAPATGLDLPLDIRGTAFQRRVWEALREIPCGSTTSYAEIAARLGRPNSVRAVGQACAANALAVAIPCHRVVRSDGSLSGYRWGVQRKSKLLQREQESARTALTQATRHA